ncbi:MAG: peptidase M20, partial [Deinococcus sp.]
MTAELHALTDRLDPAALQQADSELFELLRIPSVSADPQRRPEMARAAGFLRAKLESLGFAARVDPTAGHPVVYAQRLGAPGLPTVLVYGHYEVQPEAPLEMWTNP